VWVGDRKMMPDKFAFRKLKFVDGTYEISDITEDWDKQDEFDETIYLHYVNLGWEMVGVEE